MASGKFPSPTHAQCKPRSLSFSHGSPSFPRGHADQGGMAGSAAALPRCVSPRLGRGDGGSRGGAGWSILEPWLPGVNGGGAARGAFDGTLWALRTCCVGSRSFHGLEALQLHMKICPPAPAAAAAAEQPPVLLPQQEREKRPSMARTRTRPNEPVLKARAAHVSTVLEVVRSLFGQQVPEEYLGMPCFAEIVRAAQETVAFAAPLATPATFDRGSSGAGAAAGESKKEYPCKYCGETFRTGQVLGGHVTSHHRRARPSLARVRSANISSSPPGSAMRKRPAMEEAARGYGKRRCIRLFGVYIVVEATKE